MMMIDKEMLEKLVTSMHQRKEAESNSVNMN